MPKSQEGTLYKTLDLHGHTFNIVYGYYEPYESSSDFGDPIPIYPDFTKTPCYTEDGYPLVTRMQSLCEHGESRFRDPCCADCPYFMPDTDLFGICRCEENRVRKNE